MNAPRVTARASARGPSPPWFGGLVTAVNFVGAAWLLVYTLLPLRPIESLGGWNYVAVAGLVPVQAVLMMFWRGHPYRPPARRTADRPPPLHAHRPEDGRAVAGAPVRVEWLNGCGR